MAVATMGNVRNELKKYLQKTDVQNVLTSSDTDKPISAAMGKQLKQELDGLSESKADATNLVNVQEQIAQKLGKNEKAADSELLDGKDSTYFATATAVQAAQATATQGVNVAATAQTAATQGVNAAAAAHSRANEAYTRAEQAFQSASNGKIVLANAITGKGVPTSTTASWQEMAGNIGKMPMQISLKGTVKDDFKVFVGDSIPAGTPQNYNHYYAAINADEGFYSFGHNYGGSNTTHISFLKPVTLQNVRYITLIGLTPIQYDGWEGLPFGVYFTPDSRLISGGISLSSLSPLYMFNIITGSTQHLLGRYKRTQEVTGTGYLIFSGATNITLSNILCY